MKYVIFDFNGTVVDDVDLSVEAINHTIKKYLKRDPLTKQEYRNIFTFPVKDYYIAAGFDFDKLDWLEVGQYWMDYYLSHRKEAPLYEGVKKLLKENHLKGYKNIIISASRHDLLEEQLKELDVKDYFDEILGISDIYATSKLPIALNFIKDKDPEECVYIGDSGHDVLVAEKMGVRCILVAKGHESKERLLRYNTETVDDIKEVKI